jgi:hypothetical protein
MRLSLLVDAQPAALPPREAPAPREIAPPPAKANDARLRLAFGGGLAFGHIAAFAPLLEARLGWIFGKTSVHVAALHAFERRLDLAEGAVIVSWSGLLGLGCHQAFRFKEAELALRACTGFAAGRFNARSRGFDESRPQARPYFGIPVEIALESPKPSFGAELALGMLIPFQRERFLVDGVGVAYDPPPVAAFAALRLKLDL